MKGENQSIDQFIFTLDVKIPDQSPIRLEVQDRILAGLDPRNDLILVDSKVLPKHFLFRKKDNILTVHYLGRDGDTFLNGLSLEQDKLYMLENGDVLKVGKVQIRVRKGKGAGNIISKKDTLPLTEKMDPPAKTQVIPEAPQLSAQLPVEKITTQKKHTALNLKPIALITYKVYAFIADIALTYLMLGFIFPTAGVMADVQEFLFPFSDFLLQFMLKHHPEIRVINYLSLFEFFIGFHALMIAGSLILGASPGAFLVGIHQSEKRNFITKRFKACIYALINIVALPLLVFDLPLYRGKNLKEILTFSKREMIESSLFTVLRNAVVPLLLIASMFSPFFLQAPYNVNITREKSFHSKYVESKTYAVTSFSGEFGVSLKSEIDLDYVLMPYFEKNKLGMVFYNTKTKNTLEMKETGRTSNAFAYFKYRYSNPLSGFSIQEDMIENQFLKYKTIQSLELALTNLSQGYENFGPLMANGFLFKGDFLKNFSSPQNLLLNTFDEKNPEILLAQGKEKKIFFFTRKGIIEFSLSMPQETKLLDDFINSVITPQRFDQTSSKNAATDPQILEVLEAFERSDYQTILTYYIKEAKKAKELKNSDWPVFLKKNIEQTARALFLDSNRIGLTKNIEKTFDDIINSL